VEDERVVIVKTLILDGADVNRMNNFGHQAIHTAAERTGDEAFAILKLLLWAGCELEKKDCLGSTPLHKAKSGRIATALIQGGADIESRKSSEEGWPYVNGNTPLYLHVLRGNIEIVEILIQAGANVNARGDKGKRPLGRCLLKTKTEIQGSMIDLLRAHGAKE
jgi:ankyrin repeat protein